ncbi:MAG: regulatory protein RecX [Candidatus Andersenbacteria bacterium]|nr:regulatory protein RecX [Candidatus Andersenbacteria bacterium]
MRKKPGKRKNIYYQAQAILSRRDHAEAEVRMKLAHKQFALPEIEEAVAWLYKQHLLDDDHFAQAYAESVLLGKPVGRRYIAAKLQQKGVKPAAITQAIEQVFNRRSEKELVQDAIARWRRAHTTTKNSRDKLYRFLASRGFSLDIITEVLADV